MALTVSETSKRMFTSDTRLYKTADGRVVGENDPARASLLVAAGGQISEDEARAAGLIDADGNPVEEKKTAAKASEPAATAAAPEGESKAKK